MISELDTSPSRDNATFARMAPRPSEFLLTLGNCIFLHAVFHAVFIREMYASKRVRGKTNSRLSTVHRTPNFFSLTLRFAPLQHPVQSFSFRSPDFQPHSLISEKNLFGV